MSVATDFRCPSCAQRLSADGLNLSALVACQRCGQEFRPIDAIDRDVPIPAVPIAGRAKPTGRPDAASGTGKRQQSAIWLGPAAPLARELASLEARVGGAGPDSPADAGTQAGQKAGAPSAKATVIGLGPSSPKSSDHAKVEPAAAPPVGPAAPAKQPGPAVAPLPIEVATASPPEAALDAPPDRVVRVEATPARPLRRATTLVELSAAAQRTLAATNERLPVRYAMLGVATVTPLLLLAMALTGGWARWLFGSLSALALGALLTWGGIHLLPRLAKRIGPLELPGSAPMWLAGGAGALSVVAGLLTWGLSEASVARFAVAGLPDAPTASAAAAATPEPPAEPADTKLTRSGHLQVGPGVLYVPTTFGSADGAFDLVLHLHGNPALVEKSVEQAGINALVHVTNLGENSDPYEQHFVVPTAFDDLLDRITAKALKLGLRDAHVKRIALSSWSAGYGGVSRIIQAKKNVARIDALLIHDGLHLGYADPKTETIDRRLLGPYLAFARQAASGDKLFVITHSDVRPPGYASTAETADAIVAAVAGTRTALDPATDSPPEVDFEEAQRAMPRASRRWLQARSMATAGSFFVYGYGGKEAVDHMAHLIQMSVTTLPHLATRWAKPADAE